VLDQFENRVRVVLCHAKVSRASRAESAYPRDNAFSGDKILGMNAFWNSFETLLGLGAEPRNLTFVQISLRGIIVFLVTLVVVRLGHNAHSRGKLRSTPSCLSFLPQYFRAPLTAQQLFSRRSAAAWFWSLSIASSLFSHSIPIGSGSWSKAGLMSSCAIDNAMYP
jgi:hypothetical protein